jgi:hypothetical protein
MSAASRFGPALKVLFLCAVFCGSCLGYVWQKDQITRLGRQIKERETRLKQLEEENEKQSKLLATMRSQAYLEMRIKEWNLGLVRPEINQMWRLSEPGRDLPQVRTEPPQYASREIRGVSVQ